MNSLTLLSILTGPYPVRVRDAAKDFALDGLGGADAEAAVLAAFDALKRAGYNVAMLTDREGYDCMVLDKRDLGRARGEVGA